MSENSELLQEKPANISEDALALALSARDKGNSTKFTVFYTDTVINELYYLWKTYKLGFTHIVIYIKEKYGREPGRTYIKKKLLDFEKRLKNGEIEKAESTRDGQYCISSKSPTKTTTFVKSIPAQISTEKSRISDSDKIEKTVLPEEVQEVPEKTKSVKKTPVKKVTEKVEAIPVADKKSTAKSVEKKEVNNSSPKKKMSIRDKYPGKFKKDAAKKVILPEEEVELLDVEVIGVGYDTPLEQELAERKVREKLLHTRLAKKKVKGEKLTLMEDRALWNLTKVDFTDPADRDEIVVEKEID